MSNAASQMSHKSFPALAEKVFAANGDCNQHVWNLGKSRNPIDDIAVVYNADKMDSNGWGTAMAIL